MAEQATFRNIYIAKLPPSFNDEKLLKLCLPFGAVVSARAMQQHRSQTCKGYGFVLFSSSMEAAQCIAQLNGSKVVDSHPTTGETHCTILEVRYAHCEATDSRRIQGRPGAGVVPLELSDPPNVQLPSSSSSSITLQQQQHCPPPYSRAGSGVNSAALADSSSGASFVSVPDTGMIRSPGSNPLYSPPQLNSPTLAPQLAPPSPALPFHAASATANVSVTRDHPTAIIVPTSPQQPQQVTSTKLESPTTTTMTTAATPPAYFLHQPGPGRSLAFSQTEHYSHLQQPLVYVLPPHLLSPPGAQVPHATAPGVYYTAPHHHHQQQVQQAQVQQQLQVQDRHPQYFQVSSPSSSIMPVYVVPPGGSGSGNGAATAVTALDAFSPDVRWHTS